MPAGKDYISPNRPESPGPLASDFSQQQVAKQRNNNYHSTSLRNMVATSVNRTALHPGGVQYVNSTSLSLNLTDHLQAWQGTH
jgi:phosphoenolpyruvate carboxykinase (ATP)